MPVPKVFQASYRTIELKKVNQCQTGLYKPVISALAKWRPGNREFDASLGYNSNHIASQGYNSETWLQKTTIKMNKDNG